MPGSVLVKGRFLFDIAKVNVKEPERRCVLLSLDEDLDKPIDLAALFGYLDKEERWNDLCTLHKGRRVGYIGRSALHRAFDTVTLGIGASDDASLPGLSGIPISLYRCPVNDCGRICFSSPSLPAPRCTVHNEEMIPAS